ISSHKCKMKTQSKCVQFISLILIVLLELSVSDAYSCTQCKVEECPPVVLSADCQLVPGVLCDTCCKHCARKHGSECSSQTVKCEHPLDCVNEKGRIINDIRWFMWGFKGTCKDLRRERKQVDEYGRTWVASMVDENALKTAPSFPEYHYPE
ncbi:unnamed protein product, partial [Owenia fusiformis]